MYYYSMKFSLKQIFVPNFGKRLSFMLPSIILMGVFVSILMEIGWGTDPASFMNQNIAALFGWSMGRTQVSVYLIMLVFTILFGVEMIGLGTITNMVVIGYTIDFCRWIWKNTGFNTVLSEGNFALRIGFFALALLLFALVAAIYINAKMGVSPYDAIPNILSNWFKKVPFIIIRIAFDFSAVGLGVIAGKLNPNGIQGSILGSILMSILLGPMITIVARPLKKIL